VVVTKAFAFRHADSPKESFYTFRYAEHREDLPNEPWVVRQAGVYQKCDLGTKTLIILLINATPQSLAHGRVVSLLSQSQLDLRTNPLLVHNVIHATYFKRWRDYLAEYERRLLPLVS
jgi:hypothetical protein